MPKVPKIKRDKEPHQSSSNSFCFGICMGIMISAAVSLGVVYYYKQEQGNQQDLPYPRSNHLLHTQEQQTAPEPLIKLIPLADVRINRLMFN
jgi:hypothetical protein